VSLGLYAVSETSTSKWTCLDADDETSFRALLEYFTLHPFPNLLIEQSRRGGHAFFFWQTPVTWQQATMFGRELCTRIGIDIEVYPKHGNPHSVKCPGTVHPKTGLVYPAINLATGELCHALDQLGLIEPIECPVTLEQCAENARCSNASEKPNSSNHRVFPGSSPDFSDLVQELSKLTSIRIYGLERGIARCAWHDDSSPSLFIKGRRMHCLSSNCGVYGDAWDVKRFVNRGIWPPKG